MKKFFAASIVAATVATTVPTAFARTMHRMNPLASGNYHSDDNGMMVRHMSRRQLDSGTWAYRARTRHGFTRPASFKTDSMMSSSSSSMSSTSSSMSSSSSN